MNKSLQKQIKIYTGVVTALLAADKASGQIVYVDVNPDTLVEANVMDSIPASFQLDVDNDSILDFNLKAFCYYCSMNWNPGWIKIQPYQGNKVNNAYYPDGGGISSSYPDTTLNVMKLNFGDTINASGNWLSNEKFLWLEGFGSIGSDHWWQGAWNPTSEKYLPFLLYKNSNNYYGWIRIKILTLSSFILKDYAYNTIPNAPIIAGDTTNASLSLNELNSGFQITQQNNIIHISSTQSLAHATVSVFDMLGKEILKQNFSGTQTEISIDKKGIYFVEVSRGEKVYRKKIFIY